MSKKIKVKSKKIEGEYTQVPVKKNRMLAVILKENKATVWKWVNFRHDHFSVDGNYYFIRPEGSYLSKNRILCSVYLEGVSTPFSHKHIKRRRIMKEIVDKAGRRIKRAVDVIEGLKFDSKLIDILLNRKLADEFTKSHMDLPNLIIIILLIVTIIVGIANIGIQFNLAGGV